MKKSLIFILILTLAVAFTACTSKPPEETTPQTTVNTEPAETTPVDDGVTDITLSDEEILLEGKAASDSDSVYVANDIVYYEDGKDFTYGEGSSEDAHSKDEADAHKVVHITKPGEYKVSGKLSKGQIAVDLGEDAEEDPEAVVTLVLDNADITCTVAPAVIFYNVYECASSDADLATKDVDTSKAGANVIIADDTENNITGSYVARIYKPDSVVLSADGTSVEDASKLHKYDGAFYSKMSMNISGGEAGNGILNINADNEGLDSEFHLTVNGGEINIKSGNDGINTNEDYVSVTTVNGGNLNIIVTGETGEGDGIDSNGWLVINGGKVVAEACSFSGDAGIDSDMGIHINGGTVIANGSMLDRIEDGAQSHAVFNFSGKQSGNATLRLENSAGETVDEFTPENDYSVLVYSSPELSDDETYSIYSGEIKIADSSSGMYGGGPGGPGDHGMMPPDRPGY